ncbi:MAG: hypothetical protein V3T86_13175 [Planctomycetota bacterium]
MKLWGEARPELAAYGKLPLSREFLLAGRETPLIRRFRDFLHAGAAHFETGHSAEGAEVRICMPSSDGKRLLLSVTRASADTGGLRSFPFSVFAVLDDAGRSRVHPGLCTVLGGLYSHLETSFQEARRQTDANGFGHAFDGESELEPPHPAKDADAEFADAAKSISLSDWSQSLIGDAERFKVLLWRVRRIVEGTQRDLSSLLPSKCGLRLPLAAGIPLEVQIDAWLSCFADPKGRLGFAPHLVFGDVGPENKPALAIFVRPLMPKDLTLSHATAPEDMLDLAVDKDPANMTGFDAFGATVSEALQNRHLGDLGALLQK